MAAARIDTGTVLALIAARLEAQIPDSLMLKRYPGEEQPVGSAVGWVHLFALDLAQIPRSQGAASAGGGDVPDMARLTAGFTVALPDALTRGSPRRLPGRVSVLRAALDGVTLQGDEHRVQFVRADESYDPVPDDAPPIRTAGVVFTALVTRESGAVILT